ncbi:MAG: histidine phosphatase family protein [Armatimonadetes bacterium]|nr:histidine phosphatase family protein [Armatimonadota bacterium]NIM23561.1 histidine phosphatase family protein [Armatimonadota bacterium]NIM67427.1 histidine phosphatase family protein [Armatimonadota bacterium]NIM75928.1 histidine phosphatase family protein [Armatimonadota bacterium]NIN05613.1 histidine phosphatase family protein [Armatimonadota bacterium]
MTKFLVIRHGETQWNREMIFRGRQDIPLSEKGCEQARRLTESLSTEPIAAVYSSPLSRAADTAAAIASGRNVEVCLREELIDMNFGEWEGLAVNEVRERYPKEFDHWARSPEEAVPPGGEGLSAIRARVREGLEEWSQRHPEETLALITHRVVCKVILCEALGLSNSAFWKIQQDVCALNAITVEDSRYVVLKMNDTCHLQGMGGDGVDF